MAPGIPLPLEMGRFCFHSPASLVVCPQFSGLQPGGLPCRRLRHGWRGESKMTRIAGIAAIGLAGFLTSGALAGPLAADPLALPGFHGTVSFNDGVLNVNVDYAVYAPGAYGAGDP